MTKINKINVNGNVYDIQDNSSGYVKGTEISDLVNQLVDEKVAEFLKAGFNTETVDELPTENISYKTIYLVPSQKSEEENIYDEYIYTSKDEWEMIGSTKTDLSNYYNKQEVEKLIDDNKEIELNNYKVVVLPDNWGELPDYELLSKIINDAYNNGTRYVIRKINENNAYKYFCIDVLLEKVTSQKTSYTCSPITLYGYGNYGSGIGIRGSWENDVFTCTGVNNTNINNSYNVLTVDNTSQYTPTSNYHPATKKYVDDSIANIDGETVFVIRYNDTSEETRVKFENYLNKYIGTVCQVILNGYPADGIYRSNSDILCCEIKTTSTSLMFFNYSVVAYHEYQTYKNVSVKVTWNDTKDKLTITEISFANSTKTRVLATNNTSSYTPTSNYHPATKKYVDDQVGAINTILATLTTVEESEVSE